LTRDSLARHFAQFFLLPLGYQRVNKSSIRAKKRVISIIKTLMVPTMEFLFILWYTKGRKKNWPKFYWPKFYWPKCISGQNISFQTVSGQKVTLAKLLSSQIVPVKESLAKVSFLPNCNSATVLC
jgi:hypothetical protein